MRIAHFPTALVCLAAGLGTPLAAQYLKLVNETSHRWSLVWEGAAGEVLARTMLHDPDTRIQNLPEGSVRAKVYDWHEQNVCNLTIHRGLGAGVASNPVVDIDSEIGAGYRGGAWVQKTEGAVPATLLLVRNPDEGPKSMYLYLIPRSDPDTIHILKHGKLETYQIAPGDCVALYLCLPDFTKTFDLQTPDGSSQHCPLFSPRTGPYANPWLDPQVQG